MKTGGDPYEACRTCSPRGRSPRGASSAWPSACCWSASRLERVAGGAEPVRPSLLSRRCCSCREAERRWTWAREAQRSVRGGHRHAQRDLAEISSVRGARERDTSGGGMEVYSRVAAESAAESAPSARRAWLQWREWAGQIRRSTASTSRRQLRRWRRRWSSFSTRWKCSSDARAGGLRKCEL